MGICFANWSANLNILSRHNVVIRVVIPAFTLIQTSHPAKMAVYLAGFMKQNFKPTFIQPFWREIP
jgi:hypothetical protein